MTKQRTAIEFLASSWEKGEFADLSKFAPRSALRRELDAAKIRSLLLDALANGRGYFEPLRVRNAIIRGPLDFSNIALQDGNILPALAFHDCFFVDPRIDANGRPVSIDLSNATVAEISFIGCRFAHLRAQNCHVHGSVDLSRSGPLNDWASPKSNRVRGNGDEKSADRDADWLFDPESTYGPTPDWPEAIEDQCSVDLLQTQIGRSFLAKGAKLRSPPPRPDAEAQPYVVSDCRYALQLSETAIGGGIMLAEGFEAWGGIKFDAAQVEGDVWLMDVVIAAGEGYALKAQATEFRGMVVFRREDNSGAMPLILGCALLVNCSMLTFAIDSGRIQRDKRGAIDVRRLDVTGDVVLGDLKTNGTLLLSNAAIGASFHLSECTLYGSATERSLIMSDASVKGSLLCNNTSCRGQVNLENAEIGRNLDFCASSFHFQGSWALYLKGVVVGRDVRFLEAIVRDGVGVPTPTPRKVVLGGGILLDRSSIGGDLIWSGIEFEPRSNEFIAFSMEGAEVAGSLRPLKMINGSVAAIDLRNAVARTLVDDPVDGWGDRSMRLLLDGFNYNLLSGPEANIRHDASRWSFLEKLLAWYSRTWSERLQRQRQTAPQQEPQPPEETAPAPDQPLARNSEERSDENPVEDPPLTLEQRAMLVGNSRWLRFDEASGRMLRLVVVILGLPINILIQMMMVYQACLWHIRQWHWSIRLATALLAFPLALLWATGVALIGTWRIVEIIALQRISTPARVRLKWLRKQYPIAFSMFRSINSHTYSPQPFEQMAKAMMTAGLDADARRILLYKQRYRRRAGTILRKPDRLLFDLIAGHGLSPWRATRTLLLMFLLGWFGVWRANVGGMLAVTVSPAATVAVDDSGEFQPVLQRASGQTVSLIRCGNTVNEALYALDVFLPLVDLRQESECDVPPTALAARPGATRVAVGGWPFPQWDIAIAHRLKPAKLPIVKTIVPVDRVDFWRVAKALYALAGWLLTSLAILTFSGVFRRN